MWSRLLSRILKRAIVVDGKDEKAFNQKAKHLEPNFLNPTACCQAIYQGAVGPVTWIVSSEMYPRNAETGFGPV